MSKPIRIAPSILAADFGKMAEEVDVVTVGGADLIHVDVMDGRFVPNLTLGPDMVRAIRKATRLPIDVHMMVAEPERHVEAFAEAGADIITIHAEATPNVQGTLRSIRRLNKRAGLAVNPQTSERVLKYILDDIDLVLVMTINPGFAGQALLPGTVPKIANAAQLIKTAGHDINLEVDGGIGVKTAFAVASAGADILVAGSAIYGQADRRQAIADIRTAAQSR